jgi:hypothetical protein
MQTETRNRLIRPDQGRREEGNVDKGLWHRRKLELVEHRMTQVFITDDESDRDLQKTETHVL